jgi:hypothetical protein
MLTAAMTADIRIRKVMRIHTVPTIEAPVGLCFEVPSKAQPALARLLISSLTPSRNHDFGIEVEDEPSGFESTRFTLTRATPFFVIPISSAARFERSRPRPRTPGPPRSLIRTFTERPVAGLVTITEEPIGKVREAAVKASGSYGSPLAVRRPAYAAPW